MFAQPEMATGLLPVCVQNRASEGPARAPEHGLDKQVQAIFGISKEFNEPGSALVAILGFPIEQGLELSWVLSARLHADIGQLGAVQF